MGQLAPKKTADANNVRDHQRSDSDGIDDVEGHCAADVDQGDDGGEEEGEDNCVDWKLEPCIDLRDMISVNGSLTEVGSWYIHALTSVRKEDPDLARKQKVVVTSLRAYSLCKR